MAAFEYRKTANQALHLTRAGVLHFWPRSQASLGRSEFAK